MEKELQELKERLSDIQGVFGRLSRASNSKHKTHWAKVGGSHAAAAMALVKKMSNEIKAVVEQPTQKGAEGHQSDESPSGLEIGGN